MLSKDMAFNMSLFRPTKEFKRLTDIKPEAINALGIKAILLDVDNTLTSYDSKEPMNGTIEWTENISKLGYKIYIVSNNYKERVGHISEKYSLPFVSFAMKPFPFGFRKARKILGLKPQDCLVIGDQIFTDIIGANLGGMKSILLEPVQMEREKLLKLKRNLEKKIRDNY